MNKFHFSFLMFSLLSVSFDATAQAFQDTSVTVVKDTVLVNGQDSASTSMETSDDSLYLPVPDSHSYTSGSIRNVPGKEVSRFKNDRDYAYANDSEYWRKEAPAEPGLFFRILDSRALGWIFLILVAGVILYGVYQLAIENNFTMLIRSRRQKKDQLAITSSEDKIDFDEAISRSQAEGDYRIAIRFLYLRMVYSLRENGIVFRDSSTNAEITRVMGKHPEAESFRWLASAYEYVFYGGFVPDLETYMHIKNKFEAFKQ